MPVLSDHLKAILYPENILDNHSENVEKDMCPTIQDFSYQCQRTRNDAGIPFGHTTPSELHFTIRLGKPDDGKIFYQQLVENELFAHTFIFNATFDQNKRLKHFDDAMVVRGYVVDVKEDYNPVKTDDQTVDQMLIEVTFLLSSITYLGKEDRHKKLEITQYN